jgi:Ni/Co efflux regulator RcnB
MNTKAIITTLLTLSIAASPAAFAQGMQGPGMNQQGPGGQQQNRPGSGNQGQQQNRPQQNGQQQNGPQQSQQNGPQRGDAKGNYQGGQSQRHDGHGRHDGRRDQGPQQARGAGPGHDLYRGGKLPPAYRHQQYVVNDWRGHHLNAPPRGQHWVQIGADYVLVAITTGLIMSVLLN